MRTHLITLIILILTACSPRLIPAPDPVQIASLTPVPVDPQPTFIPTQGNFPQMPQINSTPSSELENLIEMAKEDLTQRLSISIDQINLVEATETEWSDSSLDCPEPGMSYLQVITPGYRILLEAGEIQYEYHSNRDAYVVFCDHTGPFLLPKP